MPCQKLCSKQLGQTISQCFCLFSCQYLPGQTKAIACNTHFRSFGEYKVVKLMVKGVRHLLLLASANEQW